MPVCEYWLEGDSLDESIKQSGVQVGDVVLKVDGEPVRERMSRIGRYITASTPQAHTHTILVRLLRGSPGSWVTLTVRDRDGHERERKPRRAEGLRADSAGSPSWERNRRNLPLVRGAWYHDTLPLVRLRISYHMYDHV